MWLLYVAQQHFLYHAKETADLWYGGLGQQAFQNICA